MAFVTTIEDEAWARVEAEAGEGYLDRPFDEFGRDEYGYDDARLERMYENFFADLADEIEATVAAGREGVAQRIAEWRCDAVTGASACHESEYGIFAGAADTEHWAQGGFDALRNPEAWLPFFRGSPDEEALLEQQEGDVRIEIVHELGHTVAEAWRWWARARRRYLLRAARRALLALLALPVVLVVDEQAGNAEPVDADPPYRALAPPGELLRSMPIAAHAPPRRAYPVTCPGEARLLAVA